MKDQFEKLYADAVERGIRDHLNSLTPERRRETVNFCVAVALINRVMVKEEQEAIDRGG